MTKERVSMSIGVSQLINVYIIIIITGVLRDEKQDTINSTAPAPGIKHDRK